MSATGSAAGFRDFDYLTKGTPGYSHRLLNLYNTCTENKDTRHTISFEEAVSRLISGVKSTIRDIEIQGNTVKEFIIGKSFVKERNGVRFRPDKPTTWKLSNGINGRWRYYEEIDYSGLVALACVERDMIPDSIKQNIRFTFTDEDDDHKKKQEFVVDQQLYTLALEQRLIQHFMLIEPDERLRNHSLDTGRKSGQCKGGIIYLAFKMGSTDEKDEKDQSNDSFEETARADTEWREYLVEYEGESRGVLIPCYRKDEAEEIFKDRLGIPNDRRIEISKKMKAHDIWAVVDIRDLPESGNLRVNVLSDVKDNIKVKPKGRADSAEINRAYHVQGKSNTCTSRSPAPAVDKEKGKKVTFNDTDRELLYSRTGGVMPDKYMSIRDLKLGTGTKIRDPIQSGRLTFNKTIRDATGGSSNRTTNESGVKRGLEEPSTSNTSSPKKPCPGVPTNKGVGPSGYQVDAGKPKEAKMGAPKKSEKERKVILAEMQKCNVLPDTKDYNITVLFERVLLRKEEFEQNIQNYYSTLLSEEKGRETLKNRVYRVTLEEKKKIQTPAK